jgi:hypothetical protein
MTFVRGQESRARADNDYIAGRVHGSGFKVQGSRQPGTTKREARMRLMTIVCCALLLPWLSSRSGDAAAGLQPQEQTFTSTKYGIALQYPAGWSVDDDGDEVTFRSPDGRSIVLGRSGSDNPSEPAPGRRSGKPQCTTATTAHDVTATVCAGPGPMARRALLVLKTRDGVESRLALKTQNGDAQIFGAVVNSVRRYP